jgi:hypothetical protein
VAKVTGQTLCRHFVDNACRMLAGSGQTLCRHLA